MWYTGALHILNNPNSLTEKHGVIDHTTQIMAIYRVRVRTARSATQIGLITVPVGLMFLIS